MKNTIRLTERQKAMIGRTIEIKWGTSRGVDTYGYTTASLYFDGKRRAACNGGGYDMRGTVVGNWVASTFRDELLKLKEKHMQDGRYFCGLTFHDPNYDPAKAVIGKDCSDRTLTKGDVGSKGKTVEEAEKAGNSFGLERLQAVYKASSKFATKRHTEPSIDGACGFSEVQKVLRAIGLDLKSVCDRKNLDIYEIVKAIPSNY